MRGMAHDEIHATMQAARLLRQAFDLFVEDRDSLIESVKKLDNELSDTSENQLLRSLPPIRDAEDKMKIYPSALHNADTLRAALEMEEPKKSEMLVKVAEISGRPTEAMKMQMALAVDLVQRHLLSFLSSQADAQGVSSMDPNFMAFEKPFWQAFQHIDESVNSLRALIIPLKADEALKKELDFDGLLDESQAQLDKAEAMLCKECNRLCCYLTHTHTHNKNTHCMFRQQVGSSRVGKVCCSK